MACVDESASCQELLSHDPDCAYEFLREHCVASCGLCNDTAALDVTISLEAVIERLNALESTHSIAIDTGWVIQTAIFVMLMQLGFAMLEAGTVREHNVLATYAKNIIDVVVGTVVCVLWGFQLAHGMSPLFDFDVKVNLELFLFLAYQTAAATIVSGAMAERCRVSAYVLLSVFVSGGLFPVAVRWAWDDSGWLAELDPPFHDFAGSAVVHATGGCAALAGTLVIGARSGRWDPAQQVDFAPHNVPSVLGGTVLLWVSWFAFNAGSSSGLATAAQAEQAGRAATTTALAAACGGLVAGVLAPCMQQHRRRLRCCLGLVGAPGFDLLSFSNGILAGLVAVTAGCDVYSLPSAAAVGSVGGLLFAAVSEVRHRCRVDDVVDAFAVHGACGLWGALAVGLLHRERGLLAGGGAAQLGSQLLGTSAIGTLAFAAMLALAAALRWRGALRVSRADEERGLDAEFGMRAYSRHDRALSRCRGTAALLEQQGYAPVDLLAALAALRGIVHRPFTPQAADHKLEGEVRDILEHLDYSGLADSDNVHLAFCSHHKQDTGDAARVFVDTTRRLLKARSSSTLSRHSRAGMVEGVREKDLIYLDSTNLKDLPKLLDVVSSAANHLLLLSRSVFERPWVLAELCAAHGLGKNISVVMVEWPGEDGEKAFRYPQDLERAIHEWYIANEPREPSAASALRRQAGLQRPSLRGALYRSARSSSIRAIRRTPVPKHGLQESSQGTCRRMREPSLHRGPSAPLPVAPVSRPPVGRAPAPDSASGGDRTPKRLSSFSTKHLSMSPDQGASSLRLSVESSQRSRGSSMPAGARPPARSATFGDLDSPPRRTPRDATSKL